MQPGGADTPTFALLVNLCSGDLEPMEDMTLESVGLKERRDLQRWIVEHPELVGPDLLLIATEFDHWQVKELKVSDRLDVLFLDPSGALVVAELKRDHAPDTVELQALKYAAYCSQLTRAQVIADFAAANEIENDDARAILVDHAPSLADEELQPIKIRLVAGSFGPAVTSTVLWLREYGVDIGCVEVTARRVPGAQQAVVSGRQLIPLPEAEDYMVHHLEKEREEARAHATAAQWSWEAYKQAFSEETVALARRIFDDITAYVEQNGLDWAQALRSGWLGYMRAGGYYVSLINLYVEKPLEFAVKLPDDPDKLGLENPYPQLENRWNSSYRQWTWIVPSVADVPDVSIVLDISKSYQPVTGPMPKPSS